MPSSWQLTPLSSNTVSHSHVSRVVMRKTPPPHPILTEFLHCPFKSTGGIHLPACRHVPRTHPERWSGLKGRQRRPFLPGWAPLLQPSACSLLCPHPLFFLLPSAKHDGSQTPPASAPPPLLSRSCLWIGAGWRGRGAKRPRERGGG